MKEIKYITTFAILCQFLVENGPKINDKSVFRYIFN